MGPLERGELLPEQERDRRDEQRADAEPVQLRLVEQLCDAGPDAAESRDDAVKLYHAKPDAELWSESGQLALCDADTGE